MPAPACSFAERGLVSTSRSASVSLFFQSGLRIQVPQENSNTTMATAATVAGVRSREELLRAATPAAR